MKFLIGVVSFAMLGILFLAAPALHADAKKGHGHWDRFEMLKKKLDLSSDQVSQWKDAEKEKRDSEKLLRDKVKADEAQLSVLVDQNASDEDLKSALDGLDADHKALEDKGQKFLERLRSILSPLQQAKAVLMMGRRGGKHWGAKSCGPREGWGGHAHGQSGPDGMGSGHWNHSDDQGGMDAAPDGN